MTRKRLVARAGRPWRTRHGPGPEYADTPGWLLLFESGRGAIDILGIVAALWIAFSSIRRRISGP